MLEELKKDVCQANLRLVSEGLVIQTFGNASGIDRKSGLVAIKPSGVPYDGMTWQHMVIVDLQTAKVVEGSLRPSSDTDTHLEIYRQFPHVGGVAHTHSTYATVWAQACREIPAYGTTHADHFYGPVPCTKPLSPEEIAGAYELNIGKAIARQFVGFDPMHRPAALVAGHGPFSWGTSADDAVHSAVVLEYLATMAIRTEAINPQARPIPKELMDRHFFRKHGPAKTYGQD